MNLISKPKRRKTQEKPFSPEADYTAINPDPILPAKSSRSGATIRRGVLIMLLSGIGIVLLGYAGGKYYRQYQEQQAFHQADTANSISAYEQYGRDYPGGIYQAEVQQRIEDLGYFEKAERTGDLQAYLDRYPQGRRAEQARQRLAEWADDQAFATAQRTDTRTAYDDYLRRFPQGRHVHEADDILIRQDDLAFQNAQAFNTVLAYQDYLRHFPQGRHRRTADQALDDRAFQTAQQADSVEAYQDYLHSFPQGRHSDDVRRAIPQKQEAQAFQSAQNAHTIAAYQDYLRRFPQGKYAQDARTAMVQKDNAAFQSERNTDTIDAYQRYLRTYPQGLHAAEARSAIAKKAQGIQRQNIQSLMIPEVNIINNTGYELTIDIAGETHRLDTDSSRLITLPPGSYPFTGAAHGLIDKGNFSCQSRSRYTWTWTIQSGYGGGSLPTMPSIPIYTPPPIQYPRF